MKSISKIFAVSISLIFVFSLLLTVALQFRVGATSTTAQLSDFSLFTAKDTDGTILTPTVLQASDGVSFVGASVETDADGVGGITNQKYNIDGLTIKLRMYTFCAFGVNPPVYTSSNYFIINLTNDKVSHTGYNNKTADKTNGIYINFLDGYLGDSTVTNRKMFLELMNDNYNCKGDAKNHHALDALFKYDPSENNGVITIAFNIIKSGINAGKVQMLINGQNQRSTYPDKDLISSLIGTKEQFNLDTSKPKHFTDGKAYVGIEAYTVGNLYLDKINPWDFTVMSITNENYDELTGYIPPSSASSTTSTYSTASIAPSSASNRSSQASTRSNQASSSKITQPITQTDSTTSNLYTSSNISNNVSSSSIVISKKSTQVGQYNNLMMYLLIALVAGIIIIIFLLIIPNVWSIIRNKKNK